MLHDLSEPVYARARVIGGIVSAHRNELPVAPDPAVRAAMLNSAGRAHRYPEPGYPALIVALARELRTDPDCIVLGAGSASVLQRLIRVTCRRGSQVVFTGPTYDGLATFARQAGARVVEVPPATDGTVDVDALAAATGPSTRVVLVSNPHNPTGTLASHRALAGLVEYLDDSALLVIDEAYRGFADSAAEPNGISLAMACWARGRHQIAVVRTFSKAYGLAGLRVGFAVASPQLAAEVRAAGLPAEIAGPSAAAACAGLEQPGRRTRDIATVIAERTRLRDELRRLGFTVPNSHANFLWLDVGSDSAMLAEFFSDHDAQVQCFDGAGVRISVGNAEDNDRILRTAYRWVSAEGRESTGGTPPSAG
jgi:histidinol-phosphate aminotransferase